MTKFAIIGGTGLTNLDDLTVIQSKVIETPYGKPSSVLQVGELAGSEVVFLARHGVGHSIPPHKINYRANIWALKSIGVTDIIAIAAVGGIHPEMSPQKVIIPEQIIDYTYDRKHTYFEDELTEVTHIDFTQPYAEALRQKLLQAAKQCKIEVYNGGVYGATQGPRLETAAEIKRLQNDGCGLVGMTGMPEASLSKELGLNYACCALCVNWAAGVTNAEITMDEIRLALENGMHAVKSILVSVIGDKPMDGKI